MCIGFIAVTKKGQDLTRPGEKDDLRQIIDIRPRGASEETWPSSTRWVGRNPKYKHQITNKHQIKIPKS